MIVSGQRLVTVFHGTSVENLPSIRKLGILGKPPKPNPWSYPVGWVFVTTRPEQARHYAYLSFGPDGMGKRLRVAILKIRVCQKELFPDPVDGYLGIPGSFVLKRDVRPSEISEVSIMDMEIDF